MISKPSCDYCKKKLPKGRRRFCCDKHKDRYHNETNPRGIYAHLATIESVGEEYDPIEDSMHPGDPYALGQE